MIGRRIFSAKGSPMTNISLQVSCITRSPPCRRLALFHTLRELLKAVRSYNRFPASLDFHTILTNFWMSLVPVGVRLEGPPRLDYRVIVARSTNELQSDGQILIRESARNGHRRKAADIADAAERIGKSQISLEIQRQRCCWNGLGCRRNNVKRIKQGIHLFLSDFSHFEGLQIVCRGILLVYIAGDLP